MSRHVLATGVSRGVGHAITYQFASDGSDVSVHCRNGCTEADAIAAGIQASKDSARVPQFDTRDRATCYTQFGADAEVYDAYYDIVLCIGVMRDAALPALTDEDWDIVLEASLDGFYNVVHLFTIPMVCARKGGRIATIVSVSGVMGNHGWINYSTVKAELIGAIKALAAELALRETIVNCVAPGLIEVGMLTHMEHVGQAPQAVPTRWVGQPAEAAAVVGFLMSGVASYVTWQVIGVNGGMV